jgi:hypothetical protein
MSTPISFYGGSTVFDGRVRKLNASSFRELVERYVFIPIQFPMTRREFHSLPEKERDDRKNGPFIVACSYPFDEGKREDDTATEVVMVIVDLDEGDFVKDFAEAPDTIGEHLWPYSFVCWQTAKHTPEKPRLKVAVAVEPCNPSMHRRFVQLVFDRLGLPSQFKGRRESLVLSQPQYRPLQFKGEEATAVIASRLDGTSMHVSDLPDPSDEEDEELFGRVFACDRSADEDDFYGLMYLPVVGISVEDLREPLFAIDADSGYKQWYEVAAALRHQFTEEQEAQDAYRLFDEWSSQGTKYRGEKDTWAKWKSFRPYAKGRAPVTIRSLFKQAMDAGWENSKVATRIKDDVVEWMNSCDDADKVMQETAARIAGMPFRNDVVEEMIVIAWQKRIKELTGNRVEKATLKKEIHKVRKRDLAAKKDTRRDGLPAWLQPITYVATLDVFHNSATGIQLSPEAFNRKYEEMLMPKDKNEVPPTGRPVMLPSAYALNLMSLPRVDETLYNPTRNGEDSYYTDEETGRSYLNTYNPNSVPVPDPEHAARAGQLLSKHARIMISEEPLQELFLDYLAHLVQFPGEKILWAFAIQSGQGAGKGTLADILRKVLGSPNVKVVSPQVLRSEFNDWARDCVLCVLEEVHMPGDIRERVMNNLKQLITDRVITINRKKMDARCDVPNYVNFIAFTNKRDALHLTEGDRRWCVIHSPLQTKEQILALNDTGHFSDSQMRWLASPEGAAALRYWLLKRKISPEFPVNGPAPATKYREAVVEESKNMTQIAIEDLIADQVDPIVRHDILHAGRLCELIGGRNSRDAARVTHFLTILGFERLDSKRYSIDGSRGTIWVHPQKWNRSVPADKFLISKLSEELDEDFEV